MNYKILNIVFLISFVAFCQNELQIDSNFNGRHCRGDRGICSFELNKNKQEFNSTLSYDNHNGLLLTVIVSQLTETDVKQVIGLSIDALVKSDNLQFEMLEKYEISLDIRTAIELPKQYQNIKKGLHPAYYKDGLLFIKLQLE